MPNAIQVAGGASEPTSFAPLHTSRLFTGLWTNRNPLSDAAVSHDMQLYGLGRQDSIIGGTNTELSSKLTLIRRPGTSVYNSQTFPPINRFYSFNTFTTTDEFIRVMVDTANTVYDGTGPNIKNAIWQKSPGAGSTFFLGVGNMLYFTNGIDNKQWNFTTNQVGNWGIAAPTTAPIVSQAPRPAPPPSWQANTVYEEHSPARSGIFILDSNGNIQVFSGDGQTGGSEGSGPPPWNTNVGQITQDGTVQWLNLGLYLWKADYGYGIGEALCGMAVPSDVYYTFISTQAGRSGDNQPNPWPTGLNQQINDGPPASYPTSPSVIWTNIGKTLQWTDIGGGTNITSTAQILDPNGYLQNVAQAGKTGTGQAPQFGTELGSLTTDGSVIWVNAGPWAVAATDVAQWGYAFENSQTLDISNMSPKSIQVTRIQGNQVTLQGDGSPDPQVDTIVIYRIAQGGSTFLFLATIPAPPPGQKWTYVDTSPDTDLNPLIQAAVGGENTPLPVGATCLGYHLQRIFAAVGNVVYISTGPGSVVQGGNGNSGFSPNNTFTAQSKITRFWISPLGLVVFTVRDSYIILGSGTTDDPLYMTTFVDSVPLRSYDAFTTHLTTPYLMLGNNMVVALDPSAGIMEVSFPIADKIEDEFDPATARVTFHSESSKETALYVSDGATMWYRMAATTAPETGLNWSPQAVLKQPFTAICSTEILPGTSRLLMGPGPAGGPILQRDLTKRTDNGAVYAANTTFGSVVLAHPGQLAALAFITLEAIRVGTKAALSVLMGEVSGTFESLNRTRQDPPNLPPSDTLYSDRYHFMQNQTAAWCRHFQMDIAWPEEDAANELLTFTIFGQTWDEFRSQ